jgi:pyruvate/2-oxoglutarate dehydrogenase complex dihydrolipoamide acyltransferase (E2) component
MKIFNLPDLGEGLAEAEIVRWHVDAGDYIQADAMPPGRASAKRLGLDLAQIRGTGRRELVTVDDVLHMTGMASNGSLHALRICDGRLTGWSATRTNEQCGRKIRGTSPSCYPTSV